MLKPRVVVIGAGSTGAAIAYDLAQRGVKVTLIERFGAAAGTTGHNQAQLHSGARYAVTDPEAARECIQENLILRGIMPEALELNDGLFIALSEEHLAYQDRFLAACEACGIPAETLASPKALELEPRLNPGLLAAVRIPDGVFDPYRFTLSFIASARAYGAEFLPFTEVTGIAPRQGLVHLQKRATGEMQEIGCDAIVNAAGPWAPHVAEMAGASIEVEPSAGVMVTLGERLCNMVVNLLDLPGDGDILVPQRNSTILGTTSWTVADPDDIPVPQEHISLLLRLADWMIPGAANRQIRGAMAAARPLIKDASVQGRSTSRGFRCYDHSGQGAPGFFSVIGGKTTTARYMAERTSDIICRYLAVNAACRTALEPLVSWRMGVSLA